MSSVIDPVVSRTARSPLSLWSPPQDSANDPRQPIGDPRLDPRRVAVSVRQALRDVAAGKAHGRKLVMEPEACAGETRTTPPAGAPGERSNWKLSTLIAFNEQYGAVKIVGSNAANRSLGMARSHCLLALYDKQTMRPLAIYDGTLISALRTAAYASIVVDSLLSTVPTFDVFIFGAGVLAEHLIGDLHAHHAGRIGTVHVRSLDMRRTEAFVARLQAGTPFRLRAVDNNASLADCRLVITGSNAAAPVFAADELGHEPVVLHLGGDETPAAYIEHAFEQGSVFCDDAAAVASRNSQSLAKYFSRSGGSLASVATVLGVRPAVELLDGPRAEHRKPCLVTCVGLPALDLYVLQSLHESIQARGTP